MKKKITALITAFAISLQSLVFGGVTFADDPSTMSSVTLTPTDTTYITGVEVSVLDIGTSGEYILDVNAIPNGFEYIEESNDMMKLHTTLVNHPLLSAYKVDGEMPDPSTLSDVELQNIMTIADQIISSDPELSAMSKYMTYTFTMPKEAVVKNPDSSTDTADVFLNCVTNKDIPYRGKTTRMGSYDIVDDGMGGYKITISLDNSALWANPKEFNFGVQMQIDTNLTEISDVTLKENGDAVEIEAEVVDNYIPADPNKTASNFTIDKTAVGPGTTGNDTFVYTITAKALNGATLAGKTITDPGPQDSVNLIFGSATLGGNNLSSAATGNGFSYTFPDDSTDTEAVFTVTYNVKDDFVKDLLDNNKFYVCGDNKVTMTDPDIENFNKESQKWERYTYSYINKTGTINSGNTKQFDWTVTINTKYTYGDKIALFDKLSSNHEYIRDSLKVNGVPVTLSEGSTALYPYDELGSHINEIPYGEVMTFGTGTDAFEGFAVLLDDYYTKYSDPSNIENGETITITYSTLSNSDSEDTVTFNNDCKVAGDKLYYADNADTPAKEYDGEIKASANISTNYVPFEKKDGTYYAAKQLITWNFDVNPKYSISCENAVIVDTIPTGLVFGNGNILTGKLITNTGTETPITFTRYDGTAPEKENISEYTYYVDGDKITIGLGDILISEKITLTLETKCESELYSKMNDDSWSFPERTFTNTATIYTYNGNSWTEKTDDANCDIWSTMLQKLLDNQYPYNPETNIATWKIIVNHIALPTENLTLTELLPEGTEFAGFEKIVIYDSEHGLAPEGWLNGEAPLATVIPANDATSCTDTASGENFSWSVVSDTTADGYNQDTVTISINPGEISNCRYEIFIKSKTTEKYRTDKMGEGSDVVLRNNVNATGTVFGENFSFDSSIDQHVNYQRTEKFGEMVAGMADVIKWTCKINKDKADLSGKWIVDDLSSVGLELILDNNAYPLTIATDSGVISGTELEKFRLSQNFTDFEFIIPDDYACETLTLTFYTQIITDSKAITNKLYIRNDGEEIKKEHSSSNEVDTDDFNYSAGASTSPNPKVAIHKTDKLTGNNIENVKFKASYDKDGKTYTKSATTNSAGMAYITNLPKDILITFQEETAATGYEHSSKVYKVVFLDKLTKADFANNVYCVDTVEVTRPKLDINIQNRPTGEPAEPEDVFVIKHFSGTELSKLPVAQAESILENTMFTIYSDADCLTAVAESKLYWNSEKEYAYAVFDTLTETEKTYYIKETKTALGYKGDSTIYMCYVDAEGLVTYKNSNGDYTYVMPEVTNTKIEIDKIQFEKLFENTDLSALSVTERNTLLDGTKFTIYSDATCLTAIETVSPSWDGTKAVVTFGSGLAFEQTYYIKETTKPLGYKLCESVIKCYVNDDGSISYDTGSGYSSTAPVIENEAVVIDEIQLEKQFSDTDLTALSPAEISELLSNTEFTLYSDSTLLTVIDTANPVWDTVNEKAVLTFTASVNLLDTYYIKETASPAGYSASTIVYAVYIDEDGKVTYKNADNAGASFESAVPVYVNAKINAQSINLIKTYQSVDLTALSAQQRNSILANTKFMLYSDSECENAAIATPVSPAWDDVSNQAIITIDSGLAISTTYYLKEVSSPLAFTVNPAVYSCEVGADGNVTYSGSDTVPVCNNTLKTISPVTLTKKYEGTDLSSMSDSARNTLLSGTEFTLYLNESCTTVFATGKPVWNGTDAVVQFSSSLQLDYTYYLKETKASEGYLISDKVFKCMIDTEGNVSYFDGTASIASVVCENKKEPVVTTTTTPVTTPPEVTTTTTPVTTPPDVTTTTTTVTTPPEVTTTTTTVTTPPEVTTTTTTVTTPPEVTTTTTTVTTPPEVTTTTTTVTTPPEVTTTTTTVTTPSETTTPDSEVEGDNDTTGGNVSGDSSENNPDTGIKATGFAATMALASLIAMAVTVKRKKD